MTSKMEKDYADSAESACSVPNTNRRIFSGDNYFGEVMKIIEETVSNQSTQSIAERRTYDDKEDIKNARSVGARRHSDEADIYRMANEIEMNRPNVHTRRRHSINPVLISPKDKKDEDKAGVLSKATSRRRHSIPVVQDVGNLMMYNLRRPVEFYISRVSPLCRTVWIYVLQQQIPHIIVEMDYIAEEPKIPDALKKLPHREVPILVDKDMVVFECTAILSYLATTYTNHAGFGTSLQQRMLCESIICWASSNLFRAVCCNYVYPQFIERFSLKSSKANDVILEQGLKQLTQHLEILEIKYLSSNRYLTGNRVTIADFLVATILVKLEWTGTSLGLWPKVNKWLEQMKTQGCWETVHFTHNSVKKTLENNGMLHG